MSDWYDTLTTAELIAYKDWAQREQADAIERNGKRLRTLDEIIARIDAILATR